MIPDSLATLVVLLGPAVGLVLAAKYLRDVRSVSIHDVEVEDSGVADEAQRTPRLGDDGMCGAWRGAGARARAALHHHC